MAIKTIVMLVLFFGSHAVIVSGIAGTSWLFWSLWIVMGIGLAGIGMCIMHDGNHGSYSKNKLINKLMGLTLNLVGGSAKNWRIQHNKLHHTYTNVHEMDLMLVHYQCYVFAKAKLLLFKISTYLCMVLLWSTFIFMGNY